jgi:hypothetical protein
VITRQPIVQARRHQEKRLAIDLPEVLFHPQSIPNQDRISDSLLGGRRGEATVW